MAKAFTGKIEGNGRRTGEPPHCRWAHPHLIDIYRPRQRITRVKKCYRCWAEIDLAALRENLLWLRDRVGKRVKILTVVKADAYGHGLKHIAALLMQSGTDVFGVANLAEAQAIRSVGRGWPVLMLGACLPEEFEWAVKDDVMVTLSSREEAWQGSQTALRLGKILAVHVKVDTGMGRLGVEAERALELISYIRGLEGLRLVGLYTHFASVEDDPEFSRQQAERFERLLGQIHARGISVPMIHANNSGAILHQPQTMFNLVRPGLMVYGIVPPGKREVDSTLRRNLRPALSWKCRVSLVKEVPSGVSLSYGGTFITPRRMKIATLTAGYGDGYLRSASNRAGVLIGGRRCRLLGRITMDQMLVDVTDIEPVNSGQEAVLIGEQGEDRITVSEVADWAGTIPWEVLVAITYRVARLYRGGQAA